MNMSTVSHAENVLEMLRTNEVLCRIDFVGERRHVKSLKPQTNNVTGRQYDLELDDGSIRNVRYAL